MPNVLVHIIIWYPQYKPQHEQNDLGSHLLLTSSTTYIDIYPQYTKFWGQYQSQPLGLVLHKELFSKPEDRGQ